MINHLQEARQAKGYDSPSYLKRLKMDKVRTHTHTHALIHEKRTSGSQRVENSSGKLANWNPFSEITYINLIFAVKTHTSVAPRVSVTQVTQTCSDQPHQSELLHCCRCHTMSVAVVTFQCTAVSLSAVCYFYKSDRKETALKRWVMVDITTT